jgi:hypothetical protein
MYTDMSDIFWHSLIATHVNKYIITAAVICVIHDNGSQGKKFNKEANQHRLQRRSSMQP